MVHFTTDFELQLQKTTKFFFSFFQLVKMNSIINPWPRFFMTFLLFEILASIAFLFPLKLVLNSIRTTHFLGFASTVLLSGYFLNCTQLLKELRQRFFELDLKHCTLTENPLRRLIHFHWHCNFDPPTRLNDVWYLCNAWYFSYGEFSSKETLVLFITSTIVTEIFSVDLQWDYHQRQP